MTIIPSILKKCLFISGCFLSLSAFGQFNNVWSLGYYTNGESDLFTPFKMVFEEDSLRFESIDSQVEFGLETITHSDSDGNVVFYSNGTSLYNSAGNIMEGGLGLCLSNQQVIIDLFCTNGFNADKCNFVIPQDQSVFHLYHSNVTAFDGPQGSEALTDTLFSTTFDMSLNQGLGAVIEKRMIVLTDSIVAGTLSVLPIGQTNDFWLVYASRDFKIKSFLISNSTIIQSNQLELTCPWSNFRARPHTLFSPDGSTFVIGNQSGCVAVYDFNSGDGSFNLKFEIPFWSVVPNEGFLGLSISPNSNYLYVNNPKELYQLDISDNIPSSPLLIDTFDGFLDFFPTQFHNSQLGPNGKIYISTISSSRYFHTIGEPDKFGMACNFEQHSVELPAYNRATPYLFFDLSVTSNTNEITFDTEEVVAFPNPATNRIYIDIKENLSKNYTFDILSLSGQVVLADRPLISNSIDVSLIHNGLYILRIKENSEVLKSTKITVFK